MENKMTDRTKVEYFEPGCDGEDVFVEVSSAEAIIRMRASSVEARGHDVYEDDQTALEDFKTVHWAWHPGLPS